MSELIVLTALSAPEATTLTTKIATTVDQAEANAKDQNQPALSAFVLEKKDALVAATEPLHHLANPPQNERWAIDRANDRILAGIHKTLQGFVQTFSSPRYALTSPQKQIVDAATLLLDEFFADGTGFLQRSYNIQYGTMRLISTRSKEPHCQQAIQTLGLQPSFDVFQAALEEYGRVMGYTASPMQPGLIEIWAEALEGYLAAVIAIYPRDSALRNFLLAPYHETREQIRKRRAAQERQKEKESESLPTQPSTTPNAENTPSTPTR